MDKVTSLRIDGDLLKRAKILSIEEGITFRKLVEELLVAAVGGSELVEKTREKSQDEIVSEMLKLKKMGKEPLIIVHEKSAVELVREGRGE